MKLFASAARRVRQPDHHRARRCCSGLRNSAVDLRQSTIGDIIDNERRLVLEVTERYGACLYERVRRLDPHDQHSSSRSIPTASFLGAITLGRKSITCWRYSRPCGCTRPKRRWTSARFLKLDRSLRMQSLIRTRAFFVTEDKNGLLNSSQKRTGNAYKWLDQNYPQGSASLKEMKDDINASTAHANLVYTWRQF